VAGAADDAAAALTTVGGMSSEQATAPSPVPGDLPAPDRPLGPPGLGLRVGPGVPDAAGAGTWFALHAPSGLDGPPGVLQGGLAAGLAVDLARSVDRLGAPLHALSARLEAPTLLDVPFAARVGPGEATGWYAVETWQHARRTVRATVELTGPDPLGALADLVALADGPPPPAVPDPLYPTCFVCGMGTTHPLALRTPPAFVAPDRLSVPWVPDERLVDPVRDGHDGHVATLVVAAALDCPSAWATVAHARAHGGRAVLLGTMRLQVARGVEVMDPVRVTAMMDGADGRKLRARSAVVDSDGTPLAVFDALHLIVGELPDTGEPPETGVRSAAR
jgi:hypothetical protein